MWANMKGEVLKGTKYGAEILGVNHLEQRQKKKDGPDSVVFLPFGFLFLSLYKKKASYRLHT